jgi:hypothetical protein
MLARDDTVLYIPDKHSRHKLQTDERKSCVYMHKSVRYGMRSLLPLREIPGKMKLCAVAVKINNNNPTIQFSQS